jgi:hypothetical protein
MSYTQQVAYVMSLDPNFSCISFDIEGSWVDDSLDVSSTVTYSSLPVFFNPLTFTDSSVAPTVTTLGSATPTAKFGNSYSCVANPYVLIGASTLVD